MATNKAVSQTIPEDAEVRHMSLDTGLPTQAAYKDGGVGIKHSGKTGQMDALLAKGGIDPQRLPRSASNGEHQPLLARMRTRMSSTGRRFSRAPQRRDSTEWTGLAEFDDKPWYRRPAYIWMLIPFFVMSIAFGGVISPRLNLILNLICRKYYIEMEEADPNFTRVPIFMDRENPACRIPAVQSRVSNFTLYGNLIAGLISAMTAPKLGALSDRYGRTRLIALTSMGTLAGDIFTIAAATYPTEFPVDWILVGFFFDGLCGSFTTAFAIVNAYVTDCCPPATRGVAFSYFHGCLFFGLAFGPVTAGLITKATGSPISVFYVMLLVHVFFMIFTGLIAPESLSPKRKEQAKERYARLKEKNSHKTTWEKIRETNIFAPLKILWPKGEGTTPLLRRNLVLLAAIDTTMFGVAMGSMTVIVIYSNYAFGWGTVESSFFMSIVNSCRVLCLILIMPVIVWIFKTKPTGPPTKQKNQGSDRFDLWVIRVAVLSDTLGYVGYALANSGNMMIAAGSISSIGGLGSPTLQSALTKHVPPDKTGQVLGASGLLHALARVLAPTIFNGIYTWTVDAHPRAVFLCLTATFSCAFMMTWFVRPGVYLKSSRTLTNVPQV